MIIKVSKSSKTGASILEAVLALAIFAIVASSLASLTLGGGGGALQSQDNLEADMLANEGFGAVKAIKNRGWNELTFSQTAVSSSTGVWAFTSEGANEVIGGRLTRTINFTPVDLRTRDVDVRVSWSPRPGQTSEAVRRSRLTNWDSKRWSQTDWSGGSGQTNWSVANRYLSDNGNIEAVANPGELRLKGAPLVWATTTSPTTQTLNDVSIVSPTSGFAVGNAGFIIRLNGSNWASFQDTGNDVWNGVSMFSGTSGFVVGNGGVIRRFTGGSTWAVMTSPVTNNLNSVKMVSVSEAWAVGATGKILRWVNGNNWIQFVDTGNQAWNDVDFASPALGFVVGNGGDIYRYNGSTWTSITSPVNNALNGVAFTSATDAWAVGASGKILRWNGTVWSEFVDTGNHTWNEVHFSSPSSGFVVGNGGDIYRWNGSTWAIYSPLPATNNLFGISLNGSTGFAVGANGRIIRLSGGGYLTSGSLISSIFDMVGVSPIELIEWTQTIPVCSPLCRAEFQIRVAPDSGGSPGTWSAWQGPSGAGSYFTLASGTLIPKILNGNRFAQYQIFLTGDGVSTPSVSEVRLDYK